MLFGHKKPEMLHINYTYKYMWEGMTEKIDNLREDTTYVRRVLNAIEIFPEGPDKEVERKELKRAQERLMCSVADYDGRRAELTKYYLNHFSELEGTEQINWRPSHWPTSHDIVRGNAG